MQTPFSFCTEDAHIRHTDCLRCVGDNKSDNMTLESKAKVIYTKDLSLG